MSDSNETQNPKDDKRSGDDRRQETDRRQIQINWTDEERRTIQSRRLGAGRRDATA